MTKSLMTRPISQTDDVLHLDDELCSIGKAAKFLRVSIDSLRRWEKRGLISPKKTPGGTRYYPLDQLKALKSKAPGRLRLSKLLLSEEVEKKQTPQRNSTDGSLSYIKPETPTPFEQAIKTVDHLALAKELEALQISNSEEPRIVSQALKFPTSSILTTLGLTLTTLGVLATGLLTGGYLTNPILASKFSSLEPFNALARGYISLVLPHKAEELGFNQEPSDQSEFLSQQVDLSSNVLAATKRVGRLIINTNTDVSGSLSISGDLVFAGENVQGLVQSITGGENIIISNADPSNPTVSVTLPTNLVNSFATSTTGTKVSGDIIIGSGLSLATDTKTITASTPTLSSVRSAGGCSGCIKNDDVDDALTISSSGSVDAGALSGKVTAAKGGTGIDTSGSTGVPSIASGTWTVNTTLPVTLGGLAADITPAGAGELLYSTSTSVYDSLAAGTSGYVLTSGGAGAPVWVSQSSLSVSSGFNNITSGTNTQAAMVVGSGATLGYTGTGTIDASSLVGATWIAPGTIGSTTANTGKFTTLNATTALQINGTQIIDSSRVFTNIGTINTNTFTSTALTFGGSDPVITGTTTLSLNTTSGTGSILLGGGSGSTGCTVNDSTGDLTCVGSITGGSTGSQGYWSRSGTTLSPVTSGDSVTTSGNISATGTGAISSGGTLTASNGLTLTTGALSLTATSGSAALTLTSSATAFNINSGLFNVDTTGSKVGIGDESPDAKLDIDSSSTTGADFLITNTGVGLSGTIAGITANSVTTGDIVTLSATALSSGSMLVASGPTSTGVTDHFVKLSSDIGSTASLLNLNPDFSGSAVTGYGVYNTATDTTANANTNYGYYGSLALSGNAAKTGVGLYSAVTSSSTTGDTLVALDLVTSATGALAATQTRTIYGIRSQPASTGASANADDTLNLYGSYLNPSSTLATAGADNVYGQYITTTATHAADAGTINQYGLYVANGTSGTNGTTTKYGLYVESPTGADTNYAAIFAGGNVGVGLTGPAYKLDIGTSTASDRGINIANTAATGTNYGVYSSVTGAATANIGGYFVATGATTSRGLEVAALTSATSTGLTIGALSGTTANTGLSVGTLSGTGASSTGLTIGAISSTGANQRGILLSTLTGGTTANYQLQVGAITSIDGAANSFLNLGAISGGGATATNVAMDVGNISATGGNDFGIRLGTLTGGTTANYQITTGILTSATTTTNAQLNLGGVVTTGGTTNYGINMGALSGTGTTNYGINIAASTATGTTNYGMKIGTISGAASGTNYGLYVDTVSGAGANYAAIFAGGNVGVGTTGPSAKLHSLATTEQLRLGYDASNYFSTTVASTGGVTFDAVGSGSAFSFSDGVTANTFSSSGATLTGGTINNMVIGGTTAVAGTFTTLTGTSLSTTGLTGATAASRYVGATTSGAPASGTFAVGDFIIDQTGKVYICTVAGTPGTWVATGGSTTRQMIGGSHSQGVSNGTQYQPIVSYSNSGFATDAAVSAPIPFSAGGTFTRFYVKTNSTQPADGSLVFTLMKNGSATAMTVTVAANSAAGQFTDVTNAIAYAAGDTASVRVVENAAGTSATFTWMFEVTSTSGADLAEFYTTGDKSIEAGDVVVLSNKRVLDDNSEEVLTHGVLRKSQVSYQPTLVGVISTEPGLVLGSTDDADQRLLALKGRVPVKVNGEGGPIHIGDYLTSSSTPGVAMKATHPGQIIAVALGDYEGIEVSKIEGFVNLSLADPQGALNQIMVDTDGSLITPNLKVKTLHLTEAGGLTNESNESGGLVYDMIDIGAKIREYDTKLASHALEFLNLGSTQASESAQLAGLSNKLLLIEDTVSGVSTHSAQLTQEIESSIASLSQNTTQVASHSAAIAELKNSLNNLNLTPPEILLATESATLIDLKVTSDATISGNLTALGDVKLGDTLIAGNLAIDGFFSVTNNAINVIGSSVTNNQTPTDGILYLQNSTLSNLIDLFNGQVTINKNGLLTVQKLAVSNKSLDTAIIEAGSTSVEVTSSQLSEKSKIFVSANLPIPVAVTSKDVAGHKFTISLGSVQTSDVSIDWWIVDQK